MYSSENRIRIGYTYARTLVADVLMHRYFDAVCYFSRLNADADVSAARRSITASILRDVISSG